jgi:hypothetical protein
MSTKSKIIATTLAAAGVVSASLLATGAASAATGSCGRHCASFYTERFGKGHVLDSIGRGERDGTPGILFYTSNSDPAEDWTILGLPTSQDRGSRDNGRRDETAQSDSQMPDRVRDYYAAGLVSPALNLRYGNDIAFEIEYTPYGNSTAECLGVPATPGRGTKVSLQPCGASSKTLWVVDVADVQTYGWKHYVPLINGADTNFSDPYVLTFPSGGNPNRKPRPQLETWPLLKGSHGVVADTQEWGVEFGVLR